MTTTLLLIVLAVIVIMMFSMIAFISKMYQKVPQGQAIIRSGMGGNIVSFSGMIAAPVIHQTEKIDISIKKIQVLCTGQNAILCKDHIMANMEVNFFVRINPDEMSVTKVAQSIGTKKTFDNFAIQELFESQFTTAVRDTALQFTFNEIYRNQDDFRHKALASLGTDLNGFVLDDCGILQLSKSN